MRSGRYANPVHEQQMQAILAEEYPGVLVSLSSEVLPQFREFERTMQDLLGLPIEFGSRLPEDGRSRTGFRNDGEADASSFVCSLRVNALE